MKRQKLSSNFIYQFLYQGIMLIIPLILSPYLTRTLQETALGVYSYVDSIAYYFVLLAMLGIMRYGQRIISQESGNEIKLRKAFWSLFSIHIVFSVIAIILYVFFIKIFVTENIIIYYIEILYVVSALFDITWLFYGLENFRSVVIKNAIVRIVDLMLIFIFVHRPEDLWKYTLINVGGILAGQMVMLPQAISIVKPIKFSSSDVKKHIKPLFVFFISVVAASLYTVFGKTLLGIMTIKENVAFYEYSNKIINIPKSIIIIIGTVMFPRACKMASIGDMEGQKRYIKYSFYLTSFIGMGAIFGLLSVADSFVILYYGPAFDICGDIIKCLAPLIYIIGVGDIVRTQFMIPNAMDVQYSVCIVLNAIINIIISVVLIPVLGIYGAVLGTIAAEIFGLIYQMVVCKKYLRFKDILYSALPFGIIGLLMYIVLSAFVSSLSVSFVHLTFELMLGIAIYMFLSMLYIYIFKKEIWNLIIKKFLRKE